MIVAVLDRMRDNQFGIALEIDHLPPLARLGEQVVGRRTETLARIGRKQQALAGLVDDHRDDLRSGIDVERVAHRLAEAARAGQLVRAQREEPALVGRQQQLVGGLRMQHIGGRIAFLVLELLVQRQVPLGPPHPALLRQDDGDRFLLDHRIHAEFHRGCGFRDRGPPTAEFGLGPVFLAQRTEIALQPRALARRAAKQLLQLLLLLEQVVLLAAQLHFLQLAQAAQPHVEDRFGLAVSEAELFHHDRLRIVLVADDLDHAVEVEEGGDVPFDQFQPPRDLFQPVPAAALEDVDLAGDPVVEQLLQPHHHRRAIGVEHVEVEPETGLEIGQLVEAFLEQFRIDIAAARDQHDADLRIALVAHVLEYGQLLVRDRSGYLLDQLALGDLVGNFADDQLPLAATKTFDARFAIVRLFSFLGVEATAHAEAPAPCLIGLCDRIGAFGDNPTGGEIGPLEQFHQPRVFDMRIVDHLERRIDDLGDIVARDVGRHAHSDPAGAIGEQVGEEAGHDFRLFFLIVVGRNEIDRACVEAFHQAHRGLRQPRLGIAIGGGVIAVDIAEVPLPFDQRVAQRKILREPDHRIIGRGVAMRVVLADHLAHHARRFLESAGGVELELAHGPQQAAMDRLQPVAQVGQRPCGDGGERIDEVSLGQRAVEGRIDDRVEGVGIGDFVGGHGRGLATPAHRDEMAFATYRQVFCRPAPHRRAAVFKPLPLSPR